MTKLYCAIYVSRSRPALTPFDVLTILETSRRNNAARGLTGVLFANAQSFLQLLEGPLDALNQTFLRIASDPRHHDVRMLWLGRTSERMFPEWYMRSVDAAEARQLDFDTLVRDDFDDQELREIIVELGGRASARWLGGYAPA